MNDIKPSSRHPRRRAPSTLPEPVKPEEPQFKTPDAAAEDDMRQTLDMPDDSPAPTRKKGRRFPFKFRKLSRKQMMIAIPVAVLLLAGGSVAAYTLLKDKPEPPKPVVKKEEPKPEPPKPITVASPLTGVQVKPELAEMPVTGVMIENSPDARPQSGLREAGIVFEAVAEGGITRFLALYQEDQPDYIGPVRSVRPYYVEWLQGYDAAIAHVGGSPEALDLIRSAGVKDLDQFHNPGVYHRISSRYAPHNMYSSVPKLVEHGRTKGYNKSNFTGFARKPDKPSATPDATSIDLTISSYLYNPHFDYDAATNSYKRSQGGQPHVDERSNVQLSSKVVVVMVVPFGIKVNGLHSDYTTIGSGEAFIFQDGTVTKGIWEKRGAKDGIRLGDANGAPIGINAGQAWVSVVGTAGSVAYR